jgi:hypothetical protein
MSPTSQASSMKKNLLGKYKKIPISMEDIVDPNLGIHYEKKMSKK